MEFTTAEFEAASLQLTVLVQRMAAETAIERGFTFEAVEDAPSTFEAVLAEFRACCETGRPFRVWNGASDDSIYTSAEGNFCFRFWHDVCHATTRLSFRPEHEIRLGEIQLARLGIDPDSLAGRIFWADTVGQTIFGQRVGGFVGHQRRFVEDVVRNGIDTAVEREAARRQAA